MSSTNQPEIDDGHYGYVPSKSVAIIFITLFAVSTIAHVTQASIRKQWFIFPTVVLCGILEILGWAGRLWAHHDVYNDIPFQIQIIATIIGPTPLLAANFVIFGRITRKLGLQFSRIGPRLYTIIFCACDIVSLTIQGVGGGIAASGETREEADKGGRIMLGGIVFQLVVIVVYSFLALEYYWRFHTDRPVRKVEVSKELSKVKTGMNMKTALMLCGLAFNTLCLFIRAIYRTIELTDGWNGRIIQTEVYFNVLDGAMVVLAIYTFNFIHPGWFLPADSDSDTPPYSPV